MNIQLNFHSYYPSLVHVVKQRTLDWQVGADGENHIRVGKLNLVDLAGSERQNKTQSEVSITVQQVICYVAALLTLITCLKSLALAVKWFQQPQVFCVMDLWDTEPDLEWLWKTETEFTLCLKKMRHLWQAVVSTSAD